MALDLDIMLVEAQTELADMDRIDVVESLRVWRIVPGLTFVLAELNSSDRLKFGRLFMHLDILLVHTLMLIVQQEITRRLLLFFFLHL